MRVTGGCSRKISVRLYLPTAKQGATLYLEHCHIPICPPLPTMSKIYGTMYLQQIGYASESCESTLHLGPIPTHVSALHVPVTLGLTHAG